MWTLRCWNFGTWNARRGLCLVRLKIRLVEAARYNYCYHMAYKTKVRKIGNSLGIVLPKEALQAMKVEEGATLYITEAPNGTVQVTPDNEHFGEMMKIAERGMQKYRNALRELAK